MPWVERTILAPDKEWLTVAEASQELGITEAAFRRACQKLKFKPIELGPKIHKWPWEMVMAIKWAMERQPHLFRVDKNKRPVREKN